MAAAMALPVACGGAAEREPRPSSDTSNVETAPRSTESGRSSYPDAYRQLELPEYPDATLIDTGRQTTSLTDGLRLTLRSAHSVTEAAAYYETQLTEAGWSSAPVRVQIDQFVLREFMKDDLAYRFTIRPEPDGGVRIELLVLRR